MSHLSSVRSTEHDLPGDFDSLALLVRETIAQRLRKSVDEIELDTAFEELGIDSLDLAELFFLLEDRLGAPMEISPDLKLAAVRDVVTVILKRQR